MKTGTYVAYRAPDGSILLDWEGKLWKTGYPAYPKDRCVELERGECAGGLALPKLYTKLKKKYGEGLLRELMAENPAKVIAGEMI